MWKIEDSDQTSATCLLCTAARDEKQKSTSVQPRKMKRSARLAYQAAEGERSRTLSLIGRAALFRFDDHERSKEHLTNLVYSQQFKNQQDIPDELWRHSSFVCAGVNLFYHKASGLEVTQVGGCLGMSAVAAFSIRS